MDARENDGGLNFKAAQTRRTLDGAYFPNREAAEKARSKAIEKAMRAA